MNKTELIAKVAETTELTKKDATKAVDAVLDAIADALKTGDKVQLIGFGNFEVRERAARKGVNPKLLKELKEQGVDDASAKEQAKVDIAATKVPAFKPAKALKESVK
ncbi:HU family DNA-binding protein [Brevibacillus brevis X23]|nr:HU family DNA-binding protein [Brevibacillus brevis X23]